MSGRIYEQGKGRPLYVLKERFRRRREASARHARGAEPLRDAA